MKIIPKETLALAKELFLKGLLTDEICKQTGLSRTSIRRYSKAENWIRPPHYLKKTFPHQSHHEEAKKKPPIANEHSMLECCRRLMWFLDNDLSR